MRNVIINLSSIIILPACIIIGILLLFVRAINLPYISHDDGISYISATGHQIQYQTSIPSNEWVSASEWQVYWKPEKFGLFGEIRKGLNLYDIHPPLYFWILHVWSFIFGVKLSTGPILNILFHVGISLLIYVLCNHQKFPNYISATAGALWMVNNSILKAASETRPYSLLGLLVLFTIFSIINFRRVPSLLNMFLLSVALLLGMLTHYQFLIIMGICLTWMVVYYFLHKNYLTILKLFTSSILGILLFLIINPGFFNSFKLQQAQVQPFSYVNVFYRLARSFKGLADLMMPDRITESRYAPVYLLLVGLFLLIICFNLFVKGKSTNKKPKQIFTSLFYEDSFIFVISTLSTLVIIFTYVLSMSPRHAMGVKYLMLVSPLLFIVLAQILSVADTKYHCKTVLFTLLLLTSHLYYGIHSTIQYRFGIVNQNHPYFYDSLEPIIFDSVARGEIPRNLWYANPNTLIYATTQNLLIENFDKINKPHHFYFVSSNRYNNNDSEKQKRVLELLESSNYEIRKFESSNYLTGDIFELKIVYE